MKNLKGIAASGGIAIAKAFRLDNPHLDVSKKTVSNIDAEIERLDNAISKSEAELKEIRDVAEKEMGAEHAQIFSAHILVVSDPEMMGQVKDKIKSENVNAEFALNEVAAMFISIFENMDNEYMRERAADIRDVTKRVIAHLLGVQISNPAQIREQVVVIAEDLTPSDTAQLNRNYVKGFTTDIGGRTSHSAIMARSLEIPAVVGTNSVTKEVQNGDMIILDGLEGVIYINPSEELIAEYREKADAYAKQKAEWAKLKDEPTVTKDGHHVELVANIGSVDDIEGVIANGGEGVGLFRTEFLYMGKSEIPSEEDQFESYKTVLEKLNPKPVVVRTLDIGGDKELPYFDMPKEMNPFLGFRAIRLTMKNQELFRPQLRALLRASIYGNLKIMFPMIATLDEFRSAKALLLEEKENLIKEGHKVSDDIEIGMMVEIPAAAVTADLFAKEVDFFSIGTNDLVQYTMAADRMNENVSYLYQPFHPALLRLIKFVVEAAHKEGKWAGMCGEMAGDPDAVPVLLGLGLDEFSMSASSILPARSQIRGLNKSECKVPDEVAKGF